MEWIKIETQNDLPKQECLIWIMYESGEIGYSKFYNDFFTPLHKSYPRVTHYQVIQKPEPPTK